MATFGLGQPIQTLPPASEIDSSTPWMAASEGNLLLLQHCMQTMGLQINAADENGYTLLHAASSYNQMEIMQFMLSQNVNVHAVDSDGDSALHHAGTAQTTQFLIQVAKANPTLKNAEGKTALQAKMEEMNELIQDEDIDDDDEDLMKLKDIVAYLSNV